MKKLALILALVFTLSLAACATPADNGDDTTTPPPLLGSNDGETYENAFFNITCTITEDGWKMYNDSEMQQRNLPILSLPVNEDYATAVSESKEFYDMYAEEEATGSSVAVRVENLQGLYGYLPSAEELRELKKSMYEGNEELVVESTTATIGESTHPALKVSWDEGGMIDTSVFIAVDGYMVIVELASIETDHADEWLGWFNTL